MMTAQQQKSAITDTIHLIVERFNISAKRNDSDTVQFKTNTGLRIGTLWIDAGDHVFISRRTGIFLMPDALDALHEIVDEITMVHAGHENGGLVK